MSLSVSSAKLTGNPDEAGWSQTYEYKPEDSEKLEKRGQIFAVISTSTREEGIEAVRIGREILTRVHEEYFGNREGSAFEALKTSVAAVINEFINLEDVEIAAVSLIDDTSYLVAAGGARIAILREGVLATLLRSEKGEVISASGQPKKSDILISGTNAFFERFPAGVIRGALSSKSPSEAAEALAPAIHAQQKGGNIGAIILKFEQGTYEEDALGKNEDLETMSASKRETGMSTWAKFREILEKYLKKNLYVRGPGLGWGVSDKRRVSGSVGAVLLFLLVVSIFFGIRQKRLTNFQAQYKERLTQASHELQEAEELFALNPERSRELLGQARSRVLGLYDEGVKKEELDELRQKIEENEEKILGEYRESLELFIDLSLLSSGFKGEALAFSNGKFYVLDKAGRKIVSVSADTKRSEVVAGPSQIDKMENFAVYSEKIYIVNSGGVFDIKERKKVIEADWIGEILPFAYAGNFYILDKGASTIYRYAGSEGAFSAKRDWLSKGITPDLSESLSFVIDGSVWILGAQGKILKFSMGNQQDFELSGVFPEVKNPKAIFTNEESEHLYILEADRERVVVVSKDGRYIAQYISSDIKDSVSLAVSEKEKKIILLKGEKLFSIDLKHLE